MSDRGCKLKCTYLLTQRLPMVRHIASNAGLEGNSVDRLPYVGLDGVLGFQACVREGHRAIAAALLARRAVAFRMLAIAQGSCKSPIEALRVAAVEAERLKLRLEVDRHWSYAH